MVKKKATEKSKSKTSKLREKTWRKLGNMQAPSIINLLHAPCRFSRPIVQARPGCSINRSFRHFIVKHSLAA